MRISLLLRREPFGEILEKTLSEFWTKFYGQPHAVRWLAERPGFVDSRDVSGYQRWLVNAYLNAIFVSNAESAIFDPVRREFSRSAHWWKRPFQQAYVAMALMSRPASWLAQASLLVAPGIEDAQHKLIVAGNHKIRILDREKGLSYGILKDGFDDMFMQRELRYRQLASSLDISSPSLVEIAPQGEWFVEEYVSGTPVNRLVDIDAAQRTVATALRMLRRLVDHSIQLERLGEYLDHLLSRINVLIIGNHLMSGEQKQAMGVLVSHLQRHILEENSSSDRRLPVAITHGDFQPANILVNADNVWLIDWEYADKRQAAYDILVYGLNARFPEGLADRLKLWVDGPLALTSALSVDGWPGYPVDSLADRRLVANLFFLEELLLHLEENAQLPLTKLGAGLHMLQIEIARWLNTLL